MTNHYTTPLTITLPAELLAWIDELAKRNFASRSDILRQAALEYVRRSDLETTKISLLKREKTKPESKNISKRKYDYKALAKKYPHVHGDHEVLAFLDDYDNDRL